MGFVLQYHISNYYMFYLIYQTIALDINVKHIIIIIPIQLISINMLRILP